MLCLHADVGVHSVPHLEQSMASFLITGHKNVLITVYRTPDWFPWWLTQLVMLVHPLVVQINLRASLWRYFFETIYYLLTEVLPS